MNKENLISYDELREIALQNGVKDNIRSVGKWAKENGYTKTIKYINRVGVAYYIKPIEIRG